MLRRSCRRRSLLVACSFWGEENRFHTAWAQSGKKAATASSAPPRRDDKTPFGSPSDRRAREPLRDLKLRSPKDYAYSTTSRALFVKEWNAMLGLCGASRPANTIPRLIFVRADAGSERKLPGEVGGR